LGGENSFHGLQPGGSQKKGKSIQRGRDPEISTTRKSQSPPHLSNCGQKTLEKKIGG